MRGYKQKAAGVGLIILVGISIGLTLSSAGQPEKKTFKVWWYETEDSALLSTLPCLIFFFFFQRHLTRGVTAAGIKE